MPRPGRLLEIGTRRTTRTLRLYVGPQPVASCELEDGSLLGNIDLSVFVDIQANIDSLTVDDIKARIQDRLLGLETWAPRFFVGTHLYRARPITCVPSYPTSKS